MAVSSQYSVALPIELAGRIYVVSRTLEHVHFGLPLSFAGAGLNIVATRLLARQGKFHLTRILLTARVPCVNLPFVKRCTYGLREDREPAILVCM